MCQCSLYLKHELSIFFLLTFLSNIFKPNLNEIKVIRYNMNMFINPAAGHVYPGLSYSDTGQSRDRENMFTTKLFFSTMSVEHTCNPGVKRKKRKKVTFTPLPLPSTAQLEGGRGRQGGGWGLECVYPCVDAHAGLSLLWTTNSSPDFVQSLFVWLFFVFSSWY